MTEKTYATARALHTAVERYFNSICYREPVTHEVPVLEDREFVRGGERVTLQVPVLDKYGHALMSVEPVTRGGKPMMREVWTRPPCLPDLLASIGVSRETWTRMCATPALERECARAGGRIEIYNIQRLDSSSANGAKFHLERKFGWSENADIGQSVAFELPKELEAWAE